jgi:signal peptidase I
MPERATVAAAAAAVLAAVAAIRRRLVLATVVGESMAPTLRDGDRVLVVRRPGDRLRRGDVVLLRAPDRAGGQGRAPREPDSGWRIKRIVAGPGDPVPDALRDRVRAAAVPAGRVLVLGDSLRGEDSRVWGAVCLDRVVGKSCLTWRRDGLRR